MRKVIYELTKEAQRIELDTVQECYNQCLAVECGEGECARAIRTKFNLEKYND